MNTPRVKRRGGIVELRNSLESKRLMKPLSQITAEEILQEIDDRFRHHCDASPDYPLPDYNCTLAEAVAYWLARKK